MALAGFYFRRISGFSLSHFLSFLTVVFGTIAILLSYIIPPRLATFCGVAWARLTAYASFMGVSVVGRENVDPTQSYVIVANHQSAYDIIAIYGWMGIDFRWVMKQEMRKIPFLGYACYRIGHVYIDRKNKTAAIRSLEAAKERIHSGHLCVVFSRRYAHTKQCLKSI